MLSYSGEGSMVTIAPPGSGKTQCNAFPNLLTWTGAAIVLDISGDIYEHTAAWRPPM
jgi:type IV secretion system protein VirD4